MRGALLGSGDRATNKKNEVHGRVEKKSSGEADTNKLINKISDSDKNWKKTK